MVLGVYQGSMSEVLVTIARFRDLHEALLAQGKLESAGIEAVLADDEMVRMDWLYSNAIGGIRMQVAEEDADSARVLLDEPIPEQLQDEYTGEEFEQPHCPSCGSLDIEFGQRKGAKILTWLVLGFPLPIPGKQRWKCCDCGAEWIDTNEETEASETPYE